MNAGLKNRGKTREDIEERKKAEEEHTHIKLANIASYTIDPIFANKTSGTRSGPPICPLAWSAQSRSTGTMS